MVMRIQLQHCQHQRDLNSLPVWLTYAGPHSTIWQKTQAWNDQTIWNFMALAIFGFYLKVTPFIQHLLLGALSVNLMHNLFFFSQLCVKIYTLCFAMKLHLMPDESLGINGDWQIWLTIHQIYAIQMFKQCQQQSNIQLLPSNRYQLDSFLPVKSIFTRPN